MDKMTVQIEDLKRKLEKEIADKETEKAKVEEMQEVIEVCREQLHSFDQINVISKQVIDKLERSVGEYKFDLEQAKDTIEKQHTMYYSLVMNNF